jgi:hypothetical protein
MEAFLVNHNTCKVVCPGCGVEFDPARFPTHDQLMTCSHCRHTYWYLPVSVDQSTVVRSTVIQDSWRLDCRHHVPRSYLDTARFHCPDCATRLRLRFVPQYDRKVKCPACGTHHLFSDFVREEDFSLVRFSA